ncbi:MAG: xanthine dehydrogenase family protein subunit M [Chloroflexi bacterium]|nr:xanthine dehydrogenase family protein subunit M [Chloroflexota bacterium]
MREFEYLEPATLEEACAMLDSHEEAKVLAGGASLMVLMKNRLVAPAYLVNLKTIPGLDNIEYHSEGGARIGALVTHQNVIESPVIRERCPLLAEAGARIASAAIRDQGTIGGNICHADPGADFPPALIALGARLKIFSSQGSREIPVDELFVDYLQPSLQPNEVLTEIEIPPPLPRTGWSFLELNKTSNSIGVVIVAVTVGLGSDGKCRQLRVALGSAGMTPIRVRVAEDLAVGRELGSGLIAEIAQEAQKASSPVANVYGSAEYKREMVRVMTARALAQARERAISLETGKSEARNPK